jgi:formylglycine-generating enzyme required for sulfatase activity
MTDALFRRRGSHPPPPRPNEEGARSDAQLDWELGDAVLPEIIDLTPTRTVDPTRRPFAPPPTNGHTQPATVNAAPNTPLVDQFRGSNGPRRLAALHQALDTALDRWWSDSAIPPAPLLRDGLLALEAGHDLDEGHRTLLLRSALAHRRGLLTALHHQTDPERTAFLLKEALLDVWSPLSPALLWRLKNEDEQSADWVAALQRELTEELTIVQGVQQELAARALSTLSNRQSPATTTAEQTALGLSLVLRPTGLNPVGDRRPYWSPGRVVVLFLLAIALLVLFNLRPWPARSATVDIAGGDYQLVTADGATESVPLLPFTIDRHEVTNANYRQCVLVGRCPAPHSISSTTRPDYWTNPIYDQHPVVQIPWAAADQFCTWLGKRLPTAQEWTVAAGSAPAIGQLLRYPWGDLYEPQAANVQEAQIGDTQAVGAYSPFGDSLTGLADMAGNVAEWTATPASAEGDRYWVKGGSFADGADLALISAADPLPAASAAPTLGFRCAADQLSRAYASLE